jgi:hypothetical protein
MSCELVCHNILRFLDKSAILNYLCANLYKSILPKFYNLVIDKYFPYEDKTIINSNLYIIQHYTFSYDIKTLFKWCEKPEILKYLKLYLNSKCIKNSLIIKACSGIPDLLDFKIKPNDYNSFTRVALKNCKYPEIKHIISLKIFNNKELFKYFCRNNDVEKAKSYIELEKRSKISPAYCAYNIEILRFFLFKYFKQYFKYRTRGELAIFAKYMKHVNNHTEHLKMLRIFIKTKNISYIHLYDVKYFVLIADKCLKHNFIPFNISHFYTKDMIANNIEYCYKNPIVFKFIDFDIITNYITRGKDIKFLECLYRKYPNYNWKNIKLFYKSKNTDFINFFIKINIGAYKDNLDLDLKLIENFSYIYSTKSEDSIKLLLNNDSGLRRRYKLLLYINDMNYIKEKLQNLSDFNKSVLCMRACMRGKYKIVKLIMENHSIMSGQLLYRALISRNRDTFEYLKNVWGLELSLEQFNKYRLRKNLQTSYYLDGPFIKKNISNKIN